MLTLLARAVVAATALALHWFGSGQDQGAAGPASTDPQAPDSQAGGADPALPPESKVSGVIEGQSSGQKKPDPPGHSQGSPPTASAQDQQPPGSGDQAATAAPALETPDKVASGGTLGQQHGNATLEAPRGKGREHLKPGAALLSRSKVGGIPAPFLIHFTPRSLSRQVEAGGIRAKAPAHQAWVHTVEQDTSSWQRGAGPPGSLGRGPGSRWWQVDDSSGDRTCHPPKLDPLRLGTVVSVWDAVDAAGSSSYPQELPLSDTVQTGPLTDVSERGHRKSGPQPAPVLALDSGTKAGESKEAGPWAPRESQGSPTSEEGWPWVIRDVLVTRSFSKAPGSEGPWLEGQEWGHPFLSRGQGTTAACIVEKAGANGSGDHSLFSSGPGETEKQRDNSVEEGRGSRRGQGEPSSGQVSGHLDTGKPAPDSLSFAPSECPSATHPRHTPKSLLPSASPPVAHPHPDHLPAPSTLPRSSPPLHSRVGLDPVKDPAAPAPAPAPAATPTPAPAASQAPPPAAA